MARLNPQESFSPTLEKALGIQNVVVAKSAYGGQPIKRWYKEWSNPRNTDSKNQADLYDSLLIRINRTNHEELFKTVTFIWMQGERDAREEWGDVYYESLEGLYNQLSQDLNREDINFVIGRLSDFDLFNDKYPHWTKVRDAQVDLAESNSKFSWIDTDDLNDGKNDNGKNIENDLHMSVEGYKIMGHRFAEAAIDLIQSPKN